MDVQDRLDILQQIAAYSYAFDGKDAEGWAELFTEDGEWLSRMKEGGEPTEHLVGRAAIREWARKRHATIPDTYRSFHHQSGTSFGDLGVDRARTRTMVIITGQDVSDGKIRPATVSYTGIYMDDWVKQDGRWLIARRVLEL